MLLAQPKQAISNIFPFPFCDLLKYVIIDLEKAKKKFKKGEEGGRLRKTSILGWTIKT